MKVYFVSLGCDKNLSDSEHMLALLQDAGYNFTDVEEEADVIVLNSCCFIGDAKEESINEILRLSEYKERGALKALVVTGCLSERYQAEMEKELPEVDGILGISSWNQIVSVVNDALKKNHPHVFENHDKLCYTKKRVLTTGGYFAYLKIAEGCNKNCTYCVIPSVRGHYRSIPMEDLVEEAEELVRNGVKELILVAQETTLYGLDLYKKKSLPALLDRLCEIPDLRWIRILYCYPEEITDELVETIRRQDKIVKYLDIPIQHASDNILKRMQRATTQEEITKRIQYMREQIPDLKLRTTFITGFPGETEEEFEDLCSFVENTEFDRLGVFTYSQEEGTPAALMDHQVPDEIKEERRDTVMEIQQEIAFRKAEEMIGKTLEVMVEGRITTEDQLFAARTYMDAPDVDGFLFFHSSHDFMSGDFVHVKVTGAHEYDLLGEIVE